MSPLVSRTALMGLPRGDPSGRKAGVAAICSRISGEQFRSTHEFPLAPCTAREDWVRLVTRGSLSQYKAHIRQRQFHCGKPPPAAVPVTMIFNKSSVLRKDRSTAPYRTAGK